MKIDKISVDGNKKSLEITDNIFTTFIFIDLHKIGKAL